APWWRDILRGAWGQGFGGCPSGRPGASPPRKSATVADSLLALNPNIKSDYDVPTSESATPPPARRRRRSARGLAHNRPRPLSEKKVSVVEVSGGLHGPDAV